LALAAACSSSGDKGDGVGQNNLGGNTPYTLGGANSGGGDTSNAGAANLGGAHQGGGYGDLGGSGNAGNPSNGGAGDSTSLGGNENGGNSQQDTSLLGTGSTRDVLLTGGTGNSHDVGTGGGSSVDVGTGGGGSIDVETGGGSSVDLPTGGGSSVDLPTGGGSSVDLPTGGGGSVDLGTGGGSSIDLGCVETTLTNINVYVTIDAAPSGADTEGNMYVGGNLSATGSYTVGMKNAAGCDRYALVVGGNLSIPGGGTVHGGKATYAGTSASASAVSFTCGLSRGLPPGVDFAELKSTVENLSTGLSKLAPNCTVKTAAGNKIVLTGTDPKLNVCNIDSTQLGNIDVNFPKGSSVVVNVSGKMANWTGAAVCLNGQCDDSDQATYVLWNFYEATDFAASGIAIEGSVLAPFATMDGGGGHIAGQVIVRYLKGGLEYHPYYFKGCIKWPTAV
jgi:choice-of-anchor A domain-containing protein